MTLLQRYFNSGFVFTRDRDSPVVTPGEATAPSLISTSPPTGFVEVRGSRGCRIQFIGKDAALEVFQSEIYLVHVEGNNDQRDVYQTRLFATLGNITLGTTTMAAPNSDYFYADTIASISVDAWGTALQTYIGGGANAAIYSPGSNGIAEVLISDMGNAVGLVTRFDSMASAASANALINLDF